jgi:(p)ppGpp synthase/HD superfamily hydrolase
MIDFSIEKERRILDLKLNGCGTLSLFRQKLKKSQKIKKSATFEKTLEFIESLNFTHGDLSKEAYLSHPLRLATMLLDFSQNVSKDRLNLALLHNVYEVTDTNKKSISGKFGSNVAKNIETLTVNRSKQWDRDYKKAYYEKIDSASSDVKVVKVLDKFDNIFLLCLNPDQKIRIKYLEEIREFILPLAKNNLPIIYDDFLNCCNEAEDLGHQLI